MTELKKINRIYFRVDYDENDYTNYRGIIYSINEGEEIIINNNNISIDYLDLIKVCIDNDIDEVTHSSSFDNYFMDSPDYHFIEDDLELPAPININTIKELKEYYSGHKIKT